MLPVSNQIMHLSSDLPSQLTIFVNPDGSSSFFVISERELTQEERTVDVFAEYITSDNRRYRSVSSLVIDPVDPADGLWVYIVPLQFELTKEEKPPVEFEQAYPPTQIHTTASDGVLTMTGGLTLTYELQSYVTIDGYSTVGGVRTAGLPEQFLSGRANGFSRQVPVYEVAASGTPPIRYVFVYYYRRTTLGQINVQPTGARIPRPNGRVIIIPAEFITPSTRANYTSGGLSWYVTRLRLVLPRSTASLFVVASDGVLTFQGNGVSVTTELTFNGTID